MTRLCHNMLPCQHKDGNIPDLVFSHLQTMKTSFTNDQPYQFYKVPHIMILSVKDFDEKMRQKE